jgi:hypothetical protein
MVPPGYCVGRYTKQDNLVHRTFTHAAWPTNFRPLALGTNLGEIHLSFLGKNKNGEDVYDRACGGRYVMDNGKVVSELSAQPAFDRYSLLSNDRFRTVMETVEAVRRIHSSSIDGVGAAAAVAAMMPHWADHFAEGHGAEIVVRDLEEVKRTIDALLNDLKVSLDLPDDGS